ncbi:MAG: spondin domain-containing protein [Phycisphaerales bacterium JB061]
MKSPLFFAAPLLFTVCAGLSAAQSSTAQYVVTFDVHWDNATHAGAFPPNAHFSPLVGAVHNESVAFWEPGGIATNGIEIMAETGATNTLRGEVNNAIAAGTALEVVTGPGTGAPDQVTTTFEANSDMHLLTLVTMIAPSPDWFVGTHGLNLRDDSGWIDEITIELDAYDAGTDSGPDFTSRNADVTPHEPITNISGQPPFAGVPSLGSFTITLLSETCLADVNNDGSATPTDFSAWVNAFNNNLPECDQNADGACTPTDFSAWITNYNAGC